MRIFIGLEEIAGYYTNLKKGFNEIGIESAFVNLRGHRFNYGSWLEKNPIWANLINISIQKLIFPFKKNPGFKRIWEKLPEKFLRILIFLIVLARYDAVVFAFGYSFFGLKDLKILKKFGKKIIFVFNGSDARPLFIDGFILGSRDYLTNGDFLTIKIRKQAIQIIETYSDAIINSSTTGHHFTKPYYNFIIIGLPFTAKFSKVKNLHKNKNIRILHSPSDPEAKGTGIIRKVIKGLKKKGFGIDYIELINKTNSQVISEIKSCDFVIDQLYSDIPLAGVGNEAAFYGKPAVVGSYYASVIKKDVPQEFIPPSAFCLPEDIESTVERLIKDEIYRRNLGKDARSFIKQNWSSARIARKFVKILEGKGDKKWIFDPAKISYTFGAALPASRAKKLVESAVNMGGIEALGLGDKPKLEKIFLKMIGKK